MNKPTRKARNAAAATPSTVQPDTITLNDNDLDTLESIIHHWNLAKKPDAPAWDARTVLAELALLAVRSMHGDYGPEERPPNFSKTADNPPPPLTPDPPTP